MKELKKTEIDKELNEMIEKFHTIIIAKHVVPDWDAQGSAIGLANIIADNYKDKEVIVVGTRLDNDNSFSDKNLTDEQIKEALVIVVDTANIPRIDFPKWQEAKCVFKIDHHLIVDQYGDYNMVVESAIACAQVVTLWAKKMKLAISKVAAMNLYKGIVTDSGRFLFDQTDDETFIAASTLMDAGVDLNQIQKDLYLSDLNVQKWRMHAFSEMQLTPDGVGYIIAKKADYEAYKVPETRAVACLSTLSGIKEIKIWFTVIEYTDFIGVELRSRDYAINSIARDFNGGGHKLASGCKLQSFEEVPKLVKACQDLIKQG
ncbi:DHH family phosphoesterase [Mesoplasma lactucae]|uniref:Phosphoesterase n=1 Tax=Mesoplasma lactucae ATCC 49193 TaxID=81460 RepID=A0A291ISH9_9MOLU|nr:bifunctional oligoribonuclease/PAP phosphatase NrnA [Mesoplasma lactucae]ATG97759.1 phosphoesterase [Mesoplasma lactucae ATCC 49193]ATZ20464.1 DHH family protein [Mesoplasma lactucae ATCC 49193]MCL8216636.1 Bifunctional oligoribonuclease and PAP phosphatase NrnA [Mesoplasma lactucae ATCC 49193]